MSCKPVILWTHAGETLSIQEWSDKTNIPYQTLYHRREIWGYSVAQALGFEAPPPHRRRAPRTIKTSDGREGTYEQWSEWTGLSISAIKTRLLRDKKSADETMNTPLLRRRSGHQDATI